MTAPHLARQAGFLLVGRVIAFACVFLLPLVLVRVFDKHFFGLYRQFFVVFYFFFLLGQVGMTQALTAIMPKEPEDAPSLLANLTLFLTLVGALCALLGVVLQDDQATNLWAYAQLMGLFVGVMIASSFFESLLILEQKSKQVALLIVGWDFARGLFLVVVAWWTRDLRATLWAVILAASLRYLVLLWYLRREHRITLSALSLPLFLRQLRMALPMSLQSGAHLVETHVDRYLVLFFFTPAAFAIYTIGVFQIPIVDMVFHSLSGVILPRLVELYGQGKVTEMLGLWNDTIRWSGLLFFPMFCVLFLVHEELILTLFTTRYAASVPLFGVFVWIIPTYIVANNTLLQVTEHAWYLTVAGLIKPAIAIVMVLYGLTLWGLSGAVLALVLYHYIAVLLYLLLSARALDVPVSSLFPTRSIAAMVLIAGVSCVATWWLCASIAAMEWRLVLKPLIFCGLCLALALSTPFLDETDRRDIMVAIAWLRGRALRVLGRQVEEGA